MKKLLSSLLLIGATVCLWTAPAYAHVLQTDREIGAVLHILPDDNPVSGKSVTYELSFDDTTNRFTLPACNCTINIQENGKTIASKRLNSDYDQESNNTITFPKPDVYVLQITGSPKEAGAFQPFSLSFTIRVSSGGKQVQTMPVLLWVGIASLIALIILAAYAMDISYNDEQQIR